MTSRYRAKIVEDLVSDGFEAKEIEHLLDVVAYAIERLAPTLARSAVFDLSDFATAKSRGIAGCVLTLSRQKSPEHEAWIAEFTRGNSRLRVMLTLAQPD